MKKYQETERGSYEINGMFIPKSLGNTHYRQMLVEIDAGNGEILPYLEPEKTNNQKIAMLEGSISTRRLREALLGNLESIAWIQNIDDQIEALRNPV